MKEMALAGGAHQYLKEQEVEGAKERFYWAKAVLMY